MRTVYLPASVVVRENTDLWPIFVKDSAGVFGFFRGELWDTLVKEEPAYKPRVVETLIRGLESDVVIERYNALRSMDHVTGVECMTALRVEFEKDPYRFVGVRSPDSDYPTLFTAWCDAVPSNTRYARDEGARVAQLAEPFLFAPDFHRNFLSVLGWYQPSIARKHLVEALQRYCDETATKYVAQLGRNGYAEAAASLKETHPALRDRFMALLWRVAYWDVHENDHRQWKSIAVAAGLPPDFRPPGHSGRVPYEAPAPAQQAAIEKFAEQYLADQEAEKAAKVATASPPAEPAKPALPDRVVIAPDAFVLASLVMGSPATALFNRLTELRGKVVMAFSEWARSEIVAGLEQGGLPKAKAESHADFIVSLGQVFPVASNANPLAALAQAAGTDVAYVVRDSGTVVDGVRMAPIHELITLLSGGR